jgi:hypothetical protein
MGDVGKKNEFLPVRYDVEALFKFLGNKVDGNYTASLDYKSIELKEKKVRKKEKRKYNLSESFSLQCDTNAYKNRSWRINRGGTFRKTHYFSKYPL